MHHAVQRLARRGTFVLLTDDAAGDEEEESLAHLAANLGGSADLGVVIPFLTCKHTVEYCLMFARRAAELGVAAVAVGGGGRRRGWGGRRGGGGGGRGGGGASGACLTART